MNIAVCDDNVYMCSKLESLVGLAFGENRQQYECDIFSSGDNLLQYLQQHPLAFQIYLLDIEMTGTDGLETAARIRESDPYAVIIFITSHQELMPEAFRVLAFQYLVKPFDDDKAIAVILSAVRFLQKRNDLYHYVVRKKEHMLYLSQIEYLESIGRKIVLHTVDGSTREHYGTLKAVMETLSHIDFVQVHNSYIINMEHLSTVERHTVQMKSNAVITVSAKYHDSFHIAYRKFVLARMGM